MAASPRDCVQTEKTGLEQTQVLLVYKRKSDTANIPPHSGGQLGCTRRLGGGHAEATDEDDLMQGAGSKS